MREYIISIGIYISAFTISLLCYYLYLTKKKSKNDSLIKALKHLVPLILTIAIPSIIVSFRSSGTDFNAYRSLYNNFKLYSLSETMRQFSVEKGWILLNYYSPSFRVVLVLSSFIFLLNMVLCIEIILKNNKILALTLVYLVFFGIFLNIMRQMIAVSFCTLFTLMYIKKRRFRYFFLILIGFLFHKSALIFIFVPLVLYFANKMKTYYYLFVVLLMILLPVCSPLIFKILNDLGIYASKATLKINIEPFFMICILIPIIIYCFYKQFELSIYNIDMGMSRPKTNRRIKCEKRYEKNCLYLYLLSLPIQTFGFMASYVDRLTYYFYIFLIFLIPLGISNCKKYRNEYKLVFTTLIVVYFIVVFAIKNTADMFPFYA